MRRTRTIATYENVLYIDSKPRFSPGQVVATPGAIEAFRKAGEAFGNYLTKHVQGDYGVMDADDCKANEMALQYGDRIFSAYLLGDVTKVWIITEGTDDAGIRRSTCILLPEEY
jgi:hypothetical protein